jgi:thiamine-phosphate pyrophosphorylase
MPTEPETAGGTGRSATLPRLMLVTDRRRTRGRDLVELIGRAVSGGVGMVQLREKDLPDDELRGLLDKIRRRVPDGLPLVVNGSTRAARTMRVGLHLGAGVPFPEDATDGVREDYALFGRSAHDAAEVRAALTQRPSYLILGTIFPSASKPGHPGSGLGQLEKITRLAASVPVYAIGGISVAAIPGVIRAGAHGVAVCGAILSANRPEQVAEAMALALEVSSRAAGRG